MGNYWLIAELNFWNFSMEKGACIGFGWSYYLCILVWSYTKLFSGCFMERVNAFSIPENLKAYP